MDFVKVDRFLGLAFTVRQVEGFGQWCETLLEELAAMGHDNAFGSGVATRDGTIVFNHDTQARAIGAKVAAILSGELSRCHTWIRLFRSG